MLQDGLRLLKGEHIYKDFQTVYNPGVFYINALSFKLLGISVLSSRIFALTNSLISIFLIFLIAKNVGLGKFEVIIPVLIYLFWGPTVINFVWPVMFCITTGLFVSYFFVKDVGSKRIDLRIFFTGVFSALTFIFKQNFGLAIFLANAAYFLICRKYRKFRYLLIHTTGYFIVIFLQLIYFLKTKTLSIYIKEFYYYTYVKIFREGRYNSLWPWQFPGTPWVKALKIVIYAFPLLVALYTFFVVWKSKRKSLVYIPILLGFYYLLSIRPTTDYVHLAPLIALSGLSLAIVYKLADKFKLKLILLGLAVLIIFLGVHGAILRNYYRWHTPLRAQKYSVNNPRLGILTGKEDKKSIEVISNYFLKNAKNEAEMFIYDFSPMFYLLLDKANPTRYDFLHSGILTQKIQNEVVETLEKKSIVYILGNVEVEARDDNIALYIKDNYEVDLRIDKYTIWKLKE
jgi:hypothetical protein